jgi:hypothetical protein
MVSMSAEQLIALEAALTELGALYAAAKTFTTLQPRAEAELLPRLITLGSSLRSRLRNAQLTQEEIDAVAHDIIALRSTWRVELEQLQASATYQQARAALAQDRQIELARLIPQVFAEVELVRQPPSLFFPVSPSAGRRRPGSSPFLGPVECADRIVQILAEGLTPEEGSEEWWERELPHLSCAGSMEALDTPIALRLAAADVRVAVFAASGAPSFRIFTLRLRAPLSVVLAAEATDEWWEAYDDSYRSFRTALQQELTARGHAAAVSGA